MLMLAIKRSQAIALFSVYITVMYPSDSRTIFSCYQYKRSRSYRLQLVGLLLAEANLDKAEEAERETVARGNEGTEYSLLNMFCLVGAY